MRKHKKITLCGAKLSEGYKCEHAHCCVLGDKCEFGAYAIKCKRLLELERKVKVYDDVTAIANHKDYLLTIVVADLVNNSEVTFFNERGIETYVDVRRLRESEETK